MENGWDIFSWPTVSLLQIQNGFSSYRVSTTKCTPWTLQRKSFMSSRERVPAGPFTPLVSICLWIFERGDGWWLKIFYPSITGKYKLTKSWFMVLSGCGCFWCWNTSLSSLLFSWVGLCHQRCHVILNWVTWSSCGDPPAVLVVKWYKMRFSFHHNTLIPATPTHKKDAWHQDPSFGRTQTFLEEGSTTVPLNTKQDWTVHMKLASQGRNPYHKQFLKTRNIWLLPKLWRVWAAL